MLTTDLLMIWIYKIYRKILGHLITLYLNSFDRLLLLIVFLFVEKKKFVSFIHLQGINIWKVVGLFCCLNLKKKWRKNCTDLYKRRQFRILEASKSPADSCQCGETHRCSQQHTAGLTFFAVNKRKKKLEMVNFQTVLIRKIKTEDLTLYIIFSSAKLKTLLYDIGKTCD